ncbi:MAG TPA: hypothetical protein VIY48_12290 [Candidatus Paceibacterota bacterium]
MPTIDITLTVQQLEKLIGVTNTELGGLRFGDLRFSDRAIEEKRLQSQRKALVMALSCVKFVANQ